MFALVKDNQVVRTTAEQSIEWDGMIYSNVYLLTPEERKAAGIFDLVYEQVEVPPTKKAIGSTITVGDGIVTETPMLFDKSPEELESERQTKIPQEVSYFQGCAALMQAGYLDGINAYMEAADTDPFEKLAWKSITVIRRQSAMISKVGALFGMTESQIDDLFCFAATIQA